MYNIQGIVMNSFCKVPLILLLAFFLFSCGDEDEATISPITAPQTPTINDPTPGCFANYAGNPVLESQDVQWDGVFDIDEDSSVDHWTPRWADPHVLKIGTKMVMFVSASDDFPSAADPPDPDIRLYRLESNDGISWTPNPNTPVFKRSSTPSDWDSSGTETPAVIEFQGKLHLFYTGYDEGFAASLRYRVGHATSTDEGITWTRDGNNPILSPTGVFLDFNESIVGEPAPVIHNNQLYLYFTAVGANLGVSTTLQVIGLTKTVLDISGDWDGQTWTSPVSVLEPDQSIYPRGDDWYGYTTPGAVEIEGKIHLYVSVVNDNPSWEMIHIHHVSSPDGENNWMQDSTYTFTKGDFPWINNGIHSPNPYIDGSLLMLYFSGNDFGGTGTFGVGYASCDLTK